jgi:DNA helicase-2/ATP-dependent DNA helicase PcrA
MDGSDNPSDLNEQQRQAVEAVTGPVIILAGAGSGKTTTITHRIANQVHTGAFSPDQILAVTFTDKAANELRSRLASLGVRGVEARTFHSAALSHLYRHGDGAPGRVLASKVRVLWRLRQSLPHPHRFAAPGDLATEIEWAKNRRITPETYLASLKGHRPPIPPQMMASLYESYERHKGSSKLIDFEDQLELAIQLFDGNPSAVSRFRSRYLAFTVDEFQDVNLLQRTLLDRWLGDRDDVCAVGDDHQAIYSFIGSSPDYLLDMPRRFKHARVFKLEDNYRSTPEILQLANRLVPYLGGIKKELRAVKHTGPDPAIRAYETSRVETEAIVRTVRSLLQEGIPHEEIALLYRVNFRSDDYEEALSRASIPYQVRGGAFLSRPGPRSVIRGLRGPRSTDVAGVLRARARAEGMLRKIPPDIGEEEATRQADLGRLVRLAEEFDDGGRTVADFLEDLVSRFSEGREGRGVNLLTYHGAKGLEFEAVFLPRLQEGELPYRRATTRDAIAEERRLLYVGITRAKRFLFLTWTKEKGAEPSRFLREAQLIESPGADARPIRVPSGASVLQRLRSWRADVSRRDGPGIRRVFNEGMLTRIASKRPRDWAELAGVDGLSMAEIERYGDDLIAIVNNRPPESRRADRQGTRMRWSPETEKGRAAKSYDVTKTRAEHPKAYARWTKEEEELLRKQFLAGIKISQLAKTLGRKQGGIRSRLRRLGLID